MKIFKIMKNKFKPQHIQDASRKGVTTLYVLNSQIFG